MAFSLRYSAKSDIGLGRYVNNQDSGYAGPHLLAVCDGMGGHAAGDIASSIVLGNLAQLDGESHGSDAISLLELQISQANEELLERVQNDPALAGMGTTTTALLLHGDRIALAHIGDSRCYLYRDNELIQLTQDHTFVQTLIDEGKISEEDALRHPQRSVIIRVLTGDPADQLDLSVREVKSGDRFILCSDGLTGVVSDETLKETLGSISDPTECASMLIDLALKGGGADNITCIVAHAIDSSRSETNTVPEVVGAATVHGTATSAAASSSPAAKAAALDRPKPAAELLENHNRPKVKTRNKVRLAALGVLILLIIGAGKVSYSWNQRQFFVGSHQGKVAIFKGTPQKLGPLHLAQVFEVQDFELAKLPPFTADLVRATIPANNLNDARNKVKELQIQSCDSPPPSIPAEAATPSKTSGAFSTAPSIAATPPPTPTSSGLPICEAGG